MLQVAFPISYLFLERGNQLEHGGLARDTFFPFDAENWIILRLNPRGKETPMHDLPFVARGARPFASADDSRTRDSHASEDPLPAVLKKDVAGLAFPRTTRVTEVRTETTDDN